jgi:hypothetical protein
MSTPRSRAALSKGVPWGKQPRRPDGVKTTRASSAAPRFGLDFAML